MQQVKLFKGVESELQSLEEAVNTWIRQTGARVISITGNVAPQTGRGGTQAVGLGGSGGITPSDVLVIVLYESADNE